MHNTTTDTLGGRIRAVREGLFLEQREVARRASISATTYNRIERNDTSPHASTVKRIAVALGVVPAWRIYPFPEGSPIADLLASIDAGDQATAQWSRFEAVTAGLGSDDKTLIHSIAPDTPPDVMVKRLVDEFDGVTERVMALAFTWSAATSRGFADDVPVVWGALRSAQAKKDSNR